MQIRSHSGSFEHSTIQHLHCRFNFNQIAFHIFAYFPFVKLISSPSSDLKYFSRGLIDCKWEARLVGAPRKKRKEYYPFYVDYDSNYSPPGHFEIVRVYFKPRKTVGIKRKEKNTIRNFFFLARNCLFIKKIHRSTVLHRNEIEHNRGHEPRDARHLADRAWNREEFKHNQIRDTFQPSYSVHDNPRNRFHDWKYVPLSRGILLASFGRVRMSNSLVIHRVFIVLWQNEKVYKKKKKNIESQGTRVFLYGTETLSHCMTDRKLGYHGCLRTGVFQISNITYIIKYLKK